MRLDTDPQQRQSGYIPESNEIIRQEEQERGFYPSLSAALTPYIGEEEAIRITGKASIEQGIYREELDTPVTPVRDRLLPRMTMKEAEQQALGEDVEQGNKTIKILQPQKNIMGFPVSSSDPDLQLLQKWFSWDGKQQLYRYVVTEGEHEKEILLS